MPENERNAYIKKLFKALRKQHGLAEEEQEGGSNFSFKTNNAAAQDLFGSGTTGDWYFNNSSLKAKGFNEFKSKWGNRPNVDNWFVSSMIARQKITTSDQKQGIATEGSTNNPQVSAESLNAAALLANVPLTPEKMKKSRDTVERALFTLGKSYQDYIPDYVSAISAYDSLLEKFPSTSSFEATLFNLYYCYKKLGDEANAARMLQLMKQKYPDGQYLGLINNPGVDPEKEIKSKATAQYEKIYSDFIEGNFEQALAGKKQADSLYGDKYWTSQLLYIEAVYFVHRREDSLALNELSNIQKKYPGTGIAAKAKNMSEVLRKRKQLEEYLTNLKVNRATDDSTAAANNNKPVTPAANVPVVDNKPKNATDSAQIVKQKQKVDTVQAVVKKPVAFVSAFVYAPKQSHSVVVLLNKVDPVYVTETRNAFNRYNRENYYNKTFDIVNVALNDSIKLVVINSFDSAGSAMEYMQKAQKMAPREIIPWLPATKYSFIIISDQNLGILQENKDIIGYKKFLSNYFSP